MSESIERIKYYLKRRKTSKRIDVEHIHGFDVSPDGGFELRLSDIDGAISRIEHLERDLAQAVAALEIIAAQHSGEVCGTSRSDCMAAIARASLGTIDLSLLAN